MTATQICRYRAVSFCADDPTGEGCAVRGISAGLPMLVEPAPLVTMPCSMCVAATVRSSIESSDLATRSRGCRGLLRVRRHYRDGPRVFVASVELPNPRFGALATVMRSKRSGAAAPPEGG